MYKKVKSLLLFFIFFIYIYSLPLSILPFGLGSRMILAIAGMFLLLISFLKNPRGFLRIQLSVFYLFFILIIISVYSFACALLNNTSDYEFVHFSISITLILLAAYFVTWCMRRVESRFSVDLVSEYIIGVVLLQNVISLLMFLVPEVNAFFSAMLKYDKNVQQVIEHTSSFRINGFGANFFGAGIINAFTLTIITSQMIRRLLLGKSISGLGIAFFFILFVGSMVARTTWIGGLLGIGILLFDKRTSFSGKFYDIAKFLFVFISMCILIYTVLPVEFKERLEISLNFGFELFYNYLQRGEFTSASTEHLWSMYVLPEKIHTYVLGDGYYASPLYPGSFYMDIDVGYLRMIYYFGIPGMMLFFIYQLYVFNHVNRVEPELSLLWKFLFLLVVILNFKGFADFTYIVFLYMFRKSILGCSCFEVNNSK